MTEKKNKKRLNIYFRQTPSSFVADRQTQVFAHIKRNIPYRIYVFSRGQFKNTVEAFKRNFSKITTKLPKTSRKKLIK